MNDVAGKTILTIGSVIVVVLVKPLLMAAAVSGAIVACTAYHLYTKNK